MWYLIPHRLAWPYGWISAYFSETKYSWFKDFVLVVLLFWSTAHHAPQIDCKLKWRPMKVCFSTGGNEFFFLKNFDWSPCLAKCVCLVGTALQELSWLAKLTLAFFLLFLEKEGFEDSSVEREMHSCFRKAAMSLKEIIKIPGVWDLFVKSYVDVRACFADHLPFVFPCLIFIKISVCSLVSCVWVSDSEGFFFFLKKKHIVHSTSLALIWSVCSW